MGPPRASLGRGRLVFSSSGTPTRIAGAEALQERNGWTVSLLSSVHVAAESLFSTLFPSDCRFCDLPLTNISRLPVCEDCLAAVRPIEGGTCVICGDSLPGFTGLAAPIDVRCSMCRRVPPPFAKATAFGSYSGTLRDLIHLLKYEQVRPAAHVLGKMLSEVITSLAPSFAPGTLLVPVPLYTAKLRQRGFNQSELLARAALKLGRFESIGLGTGILERTRPTVSQTGLSRHQRRKNIRGAFAVAKPDRVTGKEVLLVDDVLTTGTTAFECARTLRNAGATRVWVFTVARTLKSGPQGINALTETPTVQGTMSATGQR